MGVLWNPNSTGLNGSGWPDGALVTGSVRAVSAMPANLNAVDRLKYRRTSTVSVLDPAPAEAVVLDGRYDVIASGVSWEYGEVMP